MASVRNAGALPSSRLGQASPTRIGPWLVPLIFPGEPIVEGIVIGSYVNPFYCEAELRLESLKKKQQGYYSSAGAADFHCVSFGPIGYLEE